MNHISISVVVPIYNVETYLAECLTSLNEQTFSSYEVLLIDDGSTDNSKQIAQQFVDLSPQKFKLFSKTNGGLSDARNYGIAKALGEYITFIDSDDYVANDLLALTYTAAKKHNAQIVSFAMAEVSEQGQWIRHIPANSAGLLGDYQVSESQGLTSQSLPNACNKLFKAELFSKNNIQFPKGLWYEDLGTIPKLYFFAKRVCFIDNELYSYRNREGAITKTFSLKVMDIYKVLMQLANFYHQHDKSGIFTQDLNAWYINQTIVTLARLALCDDKQGKLIAFSEITSAIKLQLPSMMSIVNHPTASAKYKAFILIIKLGMTPTAAAIIKLLVNLKVIKV